jgi:hypothetical protein
VGALIQASIVQSLARRLTVAEPQGGLVILPVKAHFSPEKASTMVARVTLNRKEIVAPQSPVNSFWENRGESNALLVLPACCFSRPFDADWVTSVSVELRHSPEDSPTAPERD